MASQSHTVICTAGHIDHGKSSLIYCLTGVHPDRLKEEQEREMTIDLGFAFYGDSVTFIDVPGHEKFLKTMLAGVSSVDGCILVVAADDGIMPQTREHFEVLQLMGIKRGIIALTKTDLVDADWIDIVKSEIIRLTSGTFLSGSPIIQLSNTIGTGIDTFKIELFKLISQTSPRKDRGLFRMWLDRAFTIKGSGTVVAGTVLSGKVQIGDRVEIFPQGIEARVKRIQVHNTDVPFAKIGHRAALNLPGVDKNIIERGNLLATPAHFRPSYILNCRLNLLRSSSKSLQQRTRLRFHIGSSEHIGRVVLLDKHTLLPNESCFVQFRLEDQAMADIGDRFVIRSFSEGRVIGGGIVLESHPAKMKSADLEQAERLRKRESGEPRELVLQTISAAGQTSINALTLARELSFTVDDVIDLISTLARDGELVILSPAPKWQVTDARLYNQLRSAICKEIDDFHESHPHLKGAKRTDLKTRLMPNVSQILFDHLLENLSLSGEIYLSGEIVSHVSHKMTFTQEQIEISRKIKNVFIDRRFSPPDISELSKLFNIKENEVEKIVVGLCENETLILLRDPDGKAIYYSSEAIDSALLILKEFFKNKSEMRFFEFRELLKTSRKFTTPILMHFDSLGITFRDGDVRRLRRIE